MLGAPVPRVLRPVGGSSDRFTLIGTAYHPMFMEGEVIAELEEHKVEKRTFELV